MKKKQVLLGGFLAALALAMLGGIVAIVLPQRFVSDEVIFTIMLVGCYAFGILMVIAVGRELRTTMKLATFSALISMLTFVTLIWFDRHLGYRWEDLMIKVGLSTLIIALALLHRLLIVPLDPRVFWGRFSKRLAIVGAGMTSGCFIFFLVFEDLIRGDDLIVRVLGIGLLITAGASIAIGAISLFGPRLGDDEPGLLEESIGVTLTCPRCAKSLSLRSNRDQRCDGCRLKLHVRVEEPRCACGYLLYQLDADTCPECGRIINPDDRWSPSPA